MKALGIDFGEKRIGLAVSDADCRYAIAWKTLARRNDQQAVEELGALVREEAIELIVAGDPRNLDGSAGPQSERVASFLTKLAAAVQLPIETVNESLTSREAHSRLREAGLTDRQRKQRVDALAAQILLQEALDRRRTADPA